MIRVPLSILDLVPYSQGHHLGSAFDQLRSLAARADEWGFERYWLAEHHGLIGVASAATPILINVAASVTKRIRVGSGGVLLPNHPPLIVAEQFGTLETLHPNRIDLGLGRAPGGDALTMLALRRDPRKPGDDFGELIDELESFFRPAHPSQRLTAIPGAGLKIPIYILGSSLYSAHLAARLGRPYAFAGHFAPADLLEALRIYRTEFQPSEWAQRPHVILGASVIASETDERAEFLATSLYQQFLGIVRNDRHPTLPPVKDMSGLWNEREEHHVRSMTRLMVSGGPKKVASGIESLLEMTGADELMVTSNFYEHADRLRSYEILAELKRAHS